ncbi:Cell surface superoxide dismutase [Cu-Zn] 4 [Coniothyrium glycines]
MLSKVFLPLAFSAMALAQSQVTEAPPPPPIVLATAKSGVIPALPSGTPFAGVDTLQGAIIAPLPPQPGYAPNATGGLLGTASAETNQPATTYTATLPDSMFNPLVGTTIQGSLQAVGGPQGVTFTVNITNLPSQSEFGPFNWHIHTLPVPADGNCTATLGHLDPTNRGELYACLASRPETCQAGDLAGKHGGKIAGPGRSFATSFVDPYLSVVDGRPGFLGGLAFVLHGGNATRLTCANFVRGSGTGAGNATGPSATAPGSPEFTGAGAKVGVAVGAVVVVGILAAVW